MEIQKKDQEDLVKLAQKNSNNDNNNNNNNNKVNFSSGII